MPEKPVDSMMIHRPLPYVVTLRRVTGDDAPSVSCEWRGLAYSLIEAMLAASIVTTGQVGVDNDKVVVESIAPDLAAFTRMLLDEIAVAQEQKAEA